LGNLNGGNPEKGGTLVGRTEGKGTRGSEETLGDEKGSPVNSTKSRRKRGKLCKQYQRAGGTAKSFKRARTIAAGNAKPGEGIWQNPYKSWKAGAGIRSLYCTVTKTITQREVTRKRKKEEFQSDQ